MIGASSTSEVVGWGEGWGVCEGAGSSVQGSRVEESARRIRVGALALALPITSYVTLHRSFKLPDCTVFT